MPTKTEQSDLLQALYGRHGESPLPVLAASSPGQCFEAVYEAVRIAVTYRTPVILLSDLFVANSSEPWKIPSAADLPAIDPRFRTTPRRRHAVPPVRARRQPGAPVGDPRHARARSTASAGWRSWTARARSPTTARTTQRMTELRAAKVDGIEVPDLEVHGDEDADLLVLGWGSSLRDDPRGRAARARAAAAGWPRRTCATCTRCRPTPARCCARTSACWCRR